MHYVQVPDVFVARLERQQKVLSFLAAELQLSPQAGDALVSGVSGSGPTGRGCEAHPAPDQR